MTSSSRRRFEAFDADLATGELWLDGMPVRIQDLPFRLLAALLERPGEVVTRAELGQRLWGSDTFVDFEAGLNTAVAKLREALGDSADAPRFIETVPKRGYRFRAQVSNTATSDPLPSEVHDLTREPTKPAARLSAAGLGAVALAIIAIVALVLWRPGADPASVRVAVALFDNETEDPAYDRLAQVLTDSTVLRLADNRALAVIGNAAILRTDRPFRDLEQIRDTLDADLIVIGQVQRTDDGVRTLTHLIRSSDQAHVWVKATMLDGGEAELERTVTGAIDEAVRAEVDKGTDR